MYSAGVKELKQHIGEIMKRVRGGERVLPTMHGEPAAVISPVDQDAIEMEATKAEKESLGWLAESEGAFSFWNNSEDEVRGEVAESTAGYKSE